MVLTEPIGTEDSENRYFAMKTTRKKLCGKKEGKRSYINKNEQVLV
jgi:hypothetical protein